MCSGPQLASTMLFALFLVVGARSGVVQHRFLQRVRHDIPQLWRELGSRRAWFLGSEGEDSYNAGAWYLVLQAEYRGLQDSSIRSLGAQAWRSTYLAIAVLVLFGVVICIVQVEPSLSCFWH